MTSSFFRTFWEWAGAVSIRVKVLGIVLGVILLLGGLVIVQMREVLTRNLTQDLRQQGVILNDNFVQHISTQPLTDAPTIQPLLAEWRQHYSGNGHNTDIVYLLLQRPDERILVSASGDTDQAMPPEPDVVDIMTSIPDREATLRLGLSTANVEQVVNDVTLQLFALIVVMIALGFGAAFLLTWILTRPIYDLVDATQAVANGDFSRRVPRWADDELGELATAFNQMTASLEEADRVREEQEQLRNQFVSRVINAQEEERKRIARELHDSTSQSLTSVLVGLKNLQDTVEAEQSIVQLREIVADTLDEVRGMAWQLRPSVLDDLGLSSALQRYLTDYQQRYSVQVDALVADLDERVSPAMETAVYRIVQEALANVARHARADTASVIITIRQGHLHIIIEDDGVGFDPDVIAPNGKHLGLQGIRERAALFDGHLTIEAQPGQGSTLFIDIPLETPSS